MRSEKVFDPTLPKQYNLESIQQSINKLESFTKLENDYGVFKNVKSLDEANSLLIDMYAEISFQLFIENQTIITYIGNSYYFDYKNKIKTYFVAVLIAIFGMFTPGLGFLPALAVIILLILISRIRLKCLHIEKICNKWRKYDVLTYYKSWLKIQRSYNQWCDYYKVTPMKYITLKNQSYEIFEKKVVKHTGYFETMNKIRMYGLGDFDIQISYLEKRFEFKRVK